RTRECHMPIMRSLAAVLTAVCLLAISAWAEDPAPVQRGRTVRVVGADGKPIVRARAVVEWKPQSGRGNRTGMDVSDGVPSIQAADAQREIMSIRVFAATDGRGLPLNLAPVTLAAPLSGSTEVVIRMEQPGLITEGVVVG